MQCRQPGAAADLRVRHDARTAVQLDRDLGQAVRVGRAGARRRAASARRPAERRGRCDRAPRRVRTPRPSSRRRRALSPSWCCGGPSWKQRRDPQLRRQAEGQVLAGALRALDVHARPPQGHLPGARQSRSTSASPLRPGHLERLPQRRVASALGARRRSARGPRLASSRARRPRSSTWARHSSSTATACRVLAADQSPVPDAGAPEAGRRLGHPDVVALGAGVRQRPRADRACMPSHVAEPHQQPGQAEQQSVAALGGRRRAAHVEVDRPRPQLARLLEGASSFRGARCARWCARRPRPAGRAGRPRPC